MIKFIYIQRPESEKKWWCYFYDTGMTKAYLIDRDRSYSKLRDRHPFDVFNSYNQQIKRHSDTYGRRGEFNIEKGLLKIDILKPLTDE